MLGSYGKMTKVETILNKSKQVQRVTVLGEKNSADVSNRHDSSSIFAEIASNKNSTNNWKFRKKEVRHMQKYCKVLEHQTLVGKFLSKLKVPNVLKEESQ